MIRGIKKYNTQENIIYKNTHYICKGGTLR